jgi:hypothetical protein
MAGDEKTYGFVKADAEELVQLIGGADSEFPEIRSRGGGGGRLFRFALLANLSSGTASATIKSMAGTTLYTRDILDPEAIFGELTTGDTGLAIAQGGKYYVIQAPCGV